MVLGWSSVEAALVAALCLLYEGALGQTSLDLCEMTFNLDVTIISEGGLAPCASIPTQIGLLSLLTHLRLDGGEIAVVPTELGRLSNLRYIHMVGNEISVFPTEIGLLSPSMVFLHLGDNELTSIPTEVGLLNKLTTLELYSNPLVALPTEITSLNQLVRLRLDRMALTSLPSSIGLLGQLTSLNLGTNQIASLPSEVGDLSLLTFLSVSFNPIGPLPIEIFNLARLDHLDIRGIELAGLPTQVGTLVALTCLRLGANQITVVPTQLAHLGKLTELEMGNNQISALPVELGLLLELTRFTIDSNEVTDLPTEMGLLSKLTFLRALNNQITVVPSEIGGLSQLQTLIIGVNPLTGVPTEVFQLQELRGLTLRTTKFTTIPTEIALLAQLTDLDLFDIGFSSLPSEVGLLPNLQRLHLDANKLNSLPTELGRISPLKHVNLKFNELSALPSELGLLSQLTFIDVQNNRNGLRVPEQVQNLTQLKVLNFGSIQCDCTLLSWYSDYARSILQINDGSVRGSCSDENGFSLIDPIQLKLHPTAPCSELKLLNEANASSRSIKVSWQDPEIEGLTAQVSGMKAPLIYRSLAFSVISDVDASFRFQNCLANFRISPATLFFGYQVTLSRNGLRLRQRCNFASEFGYSNESTSETVLHETLGDLEPANTYEITVAPIIIDRTQGDLVFYNVGPVTAPMLITTADDKPEGNITSMRTRLREESRLLVEWEGPPFPNGEVIEYEVKVLGVPNVERTTVPSLNLENLVPNTVYEVQVRAATSAGFGGFSQSFSITTCPENMISFGDQTSCFAKRGFFLDQNSQPVDCLELFGKIRTTSCSSDDVSVKDLDLMPGFWRPNEDSFDVRTCPYGVNACPGGKFNNGSSNSLCGENYLGTLCAVCSRGFFWDGVECSACREPSFRSSLPLLFGAAAFLASVCFCWNVICRCTWEATFNGKWTNLLKVLISTYQIVATFTWTLGTSFPPLFTVFSNVLALITFDLAALECLYGSSYLTEFCVMTCPPTVLLLLILCRVAANCVVQGKEDNGGKAYNITIQAFIFVSFLVFTPVVSRIFRVLQWCDEFPDIKESFQRDDYSISCGSAEHSDLLLIGWLMFAFYCVGIPVIYAYLLIDSREDIKAECDAFIAGEEDIKPGAEIQAVSFLYQSYRYWYWELVELLRKLVLAGAIALFYPGTYEQSAFTMIFALATTALFHEWRPLRENNALGLLGYYAIFFGAFASLLLKLRTDLLESSFLDGILIVVVGSPLLFALLLAFNAIWSSGCCCSIGNILYRCLAEARLTSRIRRNSEVEPHEEAGNQDEGATQETGQNEGHTDTERIRIQQESNKHEGASNAKKAPRRQMKIPSKYPDKARL